MLNESNKKVLGLALAAALSISSLSASVAFANEEHHDAMHSEKAEHKDGDGKEKHHKKHKKAHAKKAHKKSHKHEHKHEEKHEDSYGSEE